MIKAQAIRPKQHLMASLKPKTATARKKQPIEEKIPGMHVGNTMREAREAQNLSLESVADELMIRLFYLEALENGNFKDLPERVYAIGFVKNYATYLGMDVTGTVDQFKRDAYGARSAGSYQVELAMPEPVAHSIVPNRSAIISAAIVLIALIAGIVFFAQGDKKTSPVIPAPMSNSSAAMDQKPTENNIANNETTPPAENTFSATTNAATTTAAPEFTSTTPSAAPVATPVAPAAKNRRVIEALQSSWVEIKDASGKTLFTNILKTGQLLPLPENTKVTLTTGNAGGLRLILDGAPQAAFGTVNEVKRNMLIDVPTAPAATAPLAVAPAQNPAVEQR